MSRALISKDYLPQDIDAALVKLDTKLREVIHEGEQFF
jgi:hypothetical protein